LAKCSQVILSHRTQERWQLQSYRRKYVLFCFSPKVLCQKDEDKDENVDGKRHVKISGIQVRDWFRNR